MRRTLDANVLVRGLIDDGSPQSRIADEILGSDYTLFIPSTVVVETEWVLRTRFGASRMHISELFTGLLGMNNVEVDDRAIVSNAVAAHAAGLDFADAMHLYGARESEAFLTFDTNLRRRARKLDDAVPVVVPS